MPDMQAAPQPSAAFAPALELTSLDDAELALGFECANPALQIERWQHESGAADAH